MESIMWKWTNSEDIKVMILDVDSLDQEYITYPYEKYLPKIKKYFVQKCFSPSSQNVVVYIDILELLSNIINENIPSDSVIAISSDICFLKEMMQYHIGTIYAGSFSKDNIKSIPDFRVQNLDIVKQVFNRERLGYTAEV